MIGKGKGAAHPQRLVQAHGGVDELRAQHEHLGAGKLLPKLHVDLLHLARLEEHQDSLRGRPRWEGVKA